MPGRALAQDDGTGYSSAVSRRLLLAEGFEGGAERVLAEVERPEPARGTREPTALSVEVPGIAVGPVPPEPDRLPELAQGPPPRL